jgi:tetratricopeptide (TPR) repeat protein
MMNKGYACLQAGDYRRAIPTLDRLVQLQPSNHLALINRAIASLQAGELEDSQRDYLELSKVFPAAYQVQFGLGEIAWRKKDTNAAIAAYERYLTNAPAKSAEAKTVSERLQQLKTGAP